MRRPIDFNATVYILKWDEKGYPYIVTDTLKNRVSESAETTTSPEGVMPVVFVRGCELRKWQPDGHSHIIEVFPTEEDAMYNWLERTWESDYNTSDEYTDDYSSYKEAIYWAADKMDVPVEVAESIVHWHDVYNDIESKLTARRLMKAYYKAKEASRGEMTRSLKRAVNDATMSSRFMYGRNDPYSSQKLHVEDYYSDEFKQEISNYYIN